MCHILTYAATHFTYSHVDAAACKPERMGNARAVQMVVRVQRGLPCAEICLMKFAR